MNFLKNLLVQSRTNLPAVAPVAPVTARNAGLSVSSNAWNDAKISHVGGIKIGAVLTKTRKRNIPKYEN
ncbi:MAG TPA: hypothetical protein VLF17_00395 [Candidatus Nitrosotenuis sp.]|nr:hypothetical protein [Candidatus Nitrosotenuis sp.]